MQTHSLADYFQTKSAVNKAGKTDVTSPNGPSFDDAFLKDSQGRIDGKSKESINSLEKGTEINAIVDKIDLRFFGAPQEELTALILPNEEEFENTVPSPIAGSQMVNVSPDLGILEPRQLLGTDEPLKLGLSEQDLVTSIAKTQAGSELLLRDHKPQIGDQFETLFPPDESVDTRIDGQNSSELRVHIDPRQDVLSDDIKTSLSQNTGTITEGVLVESLLTKIPDGGLTPGQNTMSDTQVSGAPDKSPNSGHQSAVKGLMLDDVKALQPVNTTITSVLGQATALISNDPATQKVDDLTNGQTSIPELKDGEGKILVPPSVISPTGSIRPDQQDIIQAPLGVIDVGLKPSAAQPTIESDSPLPIQVLLPSESASGLLSAHRPDAHLLPTAKTEPASGLLDLNFSKAQVEFVRPTHTPATGDMARFLPSNPQPNSVNPQPQTPPIPTGLTTTYQVRLDPQSPLTSPVQTPLQISPQAALPSQVPQVTPYAAQGTLNVYSPTTPIIAPFGSSLQIKPINFAAAKEITPIQVTPTPTQTPTNPINNANPAATLQALVTHPAIQPLSREEHTIRDGIEITSLGMPSQIADAPISNTIRPTADAQMARHVAQQLIEMANLAPNRPVEIALNPQELGRVRMTLHPSDGGMQVALMADRPETIDLLRRNIEMLANEFRELGYTSISFSFSGSDSGRDGHLESEDKADPAVPQDALDQPSLTPVSPSITPSGGVDLRL